MNQDTVLKRANHVTFEVVAGEAILIDMNSGTYFSLDEVGTVFWEKLDGLYTLAQLAEQIAADYNEKAQKYVAALQQAGTAISASALEDLAMTYGLEEDDVREHGQLLMQAGAESAAAQLVADFSVQAETVLSDLLDLVATMQRDNLIITVK
ncbi:MAG: PqqD family protein [Ardenticatenaceae bacterium]|nr:PqqD family protein [Ardenticatenaceae bacterium]